MGETGKSPAFQQRVLWVDSTQSGLLCSPAASVDVGICFSYTCKKKTIVIKTVQKGTNQILTKDVSRVKCPKECLWGHSQWLWFWHVSTRNRMLCEAWHQERLRLKCTPQLQVLRGETVWVTATSSVKLTILPNLRGKNGLMKGKEPTEYEEPVRSDGQMWRLKKVSGLLWTEHLHTHSVLELIWIDSVKTAGLIRSKCLRKTMRKLEEADWKPQNQVTSVATGWANVIVMQRCTT